MDKKSFLLAGLSAAPLEAHTPVQVQKMFFILDKNISTLLGGPFFNFQPYNYGPFDKDVYLELEAMSKEGLIEIIQTPSWKNYKTSIMGQRLGEEILSTFKNINPNIEKYIYDISMFVRGLSFSDLVAAIYKAYPDMRQNSVFQG